VKKYLPYVIVGLVVYMGRNRIASIPGISKLPAF
jgi:hypothetical protein